MSNPANRLRMAAKIVDFEARRDSHGRIRVYQLPAGDGGGRYEVAGINDRYHPQQAAALRQLVEAGRYDEAEDYAQRYIASYTDAADRWTVYDAIECYLRDCIFNRGAGGAAAIYQMALGVRVDRDIGPESRAAGERVEPGAFLLQMRQARERYEREVARRDENSPFWRGLVNRWNNALAFAQQFLDLGAQPNAELRVLPAAATSGARDARPGEIDLIVTEEAFAIRESGGEAIAIAAAVTVESEQPAFAASAAPGEAGDAPAAPASGLNIHRLPQPLPSRARNVRPTLIVLHATAGATAMSSINHLRSVGLGYHYIITRDGRDSARSSGSDHSTPIIFQCVDEVAETFHVGSQIPAPSGEGSINKCSIGISLANRQDGQDRYTPRQIAALHQLLAQLRQSHPSLRHLTNHALVQPWNRSDPLSIDVEAVAAQHGFTVFRPSSDEIRRHRPRNVA